MLIALGGAEAKQRMPTWGGRKVLAGGGVGRLPAHGGRTERLDVDAALLLQALNRRPQLSQFRILF